MRAPGFWDDQTQAQSTGTKYSRLRHRLEDYEGLRGQIDDMEALVEMAAEETGTEEVPPELLEELERIAADIAREVERLEEQRLFTGEFDAGDAIVSIHPGAGGTESQDWAEMLLRMYLRWAQARGFETELNEASEGEEAGIKSATFTVHGENAYGLLSAERGSAPPGAHLALRFGQPAPHLLRLCGRDPPGRRRGGVGDRREGTPRGDLPFLGGRGPAREQDRLRRAYHPRAHADGRPVPERTLPDPEPRDGHAHAARQAAPARARAAGAGDGTRKRGAEETSPGAARSARTYSLLTPWSRTTEPTTRRATSRPCSTAP